MPAQDAPVVNGAVTGQPAGPEHGRTSPPVTIGVPVYNGESLLQPALDSLLMQTFGDFELIISDNASTDGTEAICREYAGRDARIRYVRQASNIGPTANFKFVLDQARGEYFMWAACDDIRSADWVQVNYDFLKANPSYVASTSPNGFEGRSLAFADLVRFSLEGDVCERLCRFFDHCWLSHGIFYSLARTDVLRSCEIIGKSFIAADWAVDLHLARCGEINRTAEGLTVFGVRGVSSGGDAYKAFRNSRIELLFPFIVMSRYAFSLTRGLPLACRVRMAMVLAGFNLSVAIGQIKYGLYLVYRAVFKPAGKASGAAAGGRAR
jgi:glycosyltransferase involved in cell wall biosynthesis